MIIVIDVSKEKLDICAGKKHWQSPNLGDYQALTDRLKALPKSVEWVILEPRGGLRTIVETIKTEIEALDVELKGKIQQERSLKGKKGL